MKIALIGATGYVGSTLLTEALNRGHQVTALVQNIDKLPRHEHLTGKAVDVRDEAALTNLVFGHDAVLSAFSGHAQGEAMVSYYVDGIRTVISATQKAGVPRLLVVGGAGSLEVAPGVQLIDTPDFPPQYKASAEGARQALNLLRAEKALNWTLLSPSALLVPGERTGKFRLGGDQLLTGADGQSRITVTDYAVAMIDELETPRHNRTRFTVGY